MKKTVSIFLALALIVAFVPFFRTAADELPGMKFTAQVVQQTKTPDMPLTWEARIKVAKNAGSGRLGTIIGNFSNSSTVSMNLELRDNGVVARYWNNGSYAPRYDFTGYDIRTGVPVDIAVTIDLSARTASLYVDGEFVKSVSTAITSVKFVNGLVVGGDLRDSNTQYLKNSELYSVALYSDVRTADEIKADRNGADADDDDLIAAYDLTASDYEKDFSKNKNDLMREIELVYDSSEDPDTRGMYFTADDLCLTDSPIAEIPRTYEAWVKLPKGYNDRAGVILGNFTGSGACVSFEVNTRGLPRIYFTDKNGRTTDQIFSCDIRTGDWAHLAIVYDEQKSTLYCYINGSLAQTVNKTMYISAPDVSYCIGGDLRSGNPQYFKGKISSVTIFSTARSASEIAADMQSVDMDAEGLIAHYDLEGKQGVISIEDASGNGHDVSINKSWIDPEYKKPLKDYAYSIAIVGDIQVMTYYHPDDLHCIFDWLTENAESTKSAFTIRTAAGIFLRRPFPVSPIKRYRMTGRRI